MAKNKDIFGTWWASVIYPESGDITKLIDLDTNKWFNPMWISPLHDLDVNEDGEAKKPHFHVVFKTNNTVSREYVLKTYVATFGGVGAEKVHNPKGMLRYLCHLDNPDKPKYNVESVTNVYTQGFGDYEDMIQCTTDKTAIAAYVLDLLSHSGCFSFAELVYFLRKNHYIDELNYCMGHSYAVCQILKTLENQEED